MLKLLDIRLASSSGFFDAVRRLEYVVLLVLCAFSGLLYTPYGAIAALTLLPLALMLVPVRQDPTITRERARFDVLSDLQANGYNLRTRWLAVCDQPLTHLVSMQQWDIRRDALIWMSQCKSKLRPFPEVGGIFEASESRQDVIADLESCLLTLSRLRRLMTLSRSLKLPILAGER